MPLTIIDDEEIEIAVIVSIEPSGAHRPHFATLRIKARQAGLARHIAKTSAALIAIKQIAIDASDEDVLIAVVVVISRCRAHCVTFARDAGLRGHIAERAVLIVAIKAIPKLRPVFLSAGNRAPLTKYMSCQPSPS